MKNKIQRTHCEVCERVPTVGVRERLATRRYNADPRSVILRSHVCYGHCGAHSRIWGHKFIPILYRDAVQVPESLQFFSKTCTSSHRKPFAGSLEFGELKRNFNCYTLKRPWGSVALSTWHPSIRKKLALTSPTGGGRSVGIVRSWTKATELMYVCMYVLKCYKC